MSHVQYNTYNDDDDEIISACHYKLKYAPVTNGKSPNRDSAITTTATVVFMSPTTTAEETGFLLRTVSWTDRLMMMMTTMTIVGAL